MKKLISRGYLFIILAFIYIPIFILIAFSFNSGKVIGVWEGFSFIWYENLGQVSDVILNTVILALISSIIATLLGTMGAIGIFYSKGRRKRLLSGISQIPVVNSEIVTACALVMTFLLLGLPHRSIIWLYIGHIILSAPFVVLSVMPKLKQMDDSLYEAALDLGASPVQALWKVVIPQILPGIITGFMLAITLSLDDYIITATLAPQGFYSISTAVYKAIAVSTREASMKVPIYRALTTIIFLITVLVVVILNIRASKKRRQANGK